MIVRTSVSVVSVVTIASKRSVITFDLTGFTNVFGRGRIAAIIGVVELSDEEIRGN